MSDNLSINEMVAKYLEALDRTNNNEFAFSYDEQEEFNEFFKQYPELEQMRQELLQQKVPEFRQNIANSYLKDISKYQDLEGQLTSLGFNMKNFKDVTLSNDKRLIVFFTSDSPEPVVIEYDPNANIIEDLRQRQIDYKQYQGSDMSFNAEEMLKDLAKEKNLYAGVRPLEKYEPDSKYFRDPEKMRIISSLLKQAEVKNAGLNFDQKFAYIDEENNCIISKTGVVLEAKVDSLTQDITVESPDSQKEFIDEDINDKDVAQVESDVITGNDVELKDEDYTVDDEEFDEQGQKPNKYRAAVEKVIARNSYDIDDEKKEEIIENVQKLDEGTATIEEFPAAQQEFYEQCLLEAQALAISEQEVYKETTLDDNNRDFVKESTYTHTLTYKPSKKSSSNSQEAAFSNYLYIALVVLVIAFAIFMFIIFRR